MRSPRGLAASSLAIVNRTVRKLGTAYGYLQILHKIDNTAFYFQSLVTWNTNDLQKRNDWIDY